MPQKSTVATSLFIPLSKINTLCLRSYDENDDKTLMGEEKSELLTTLATNPEIAVYRFGLANKLQFPFLPFFGACGRSTFVQGPVVPLKNYMDQPLEVRLQLGKCTNVFISPRLLNTTKAIFLILRVNLFQQRKF